MSTDIQSPSFVEIVQIHQCLRSEVNELARIIERAANDVTLRPEALRRFEALRSIYESHSKAEDEIIFPELQARGLSIDACEELDRQHNGQSDAFVRLERVLRCWSDDAVELVDELRASIVLHLRLEEEEVLPLLGSNFQRQELGFLIGRVIGDRSSEVMEAILGMLCRNLPPDMVRAVVADLEQAAVGTNFSRWIESKKHPSHNPHCRKIPTLHPEVQLGVQHNATPSYVPSGQNYGCSHYTRGLKVWAQCCQKLYPCNRCHDEAVGDSHAIDVSSRQAWCMSCGSFQSNPGSSCVKCNAVFGTYHCSNCDIWESGPKSSVYHCPYCNVCRVGSGLGNDFFHCMRCNACISTKMRFHKCVEGSLDRDCPVCCESLFSTTKPVQYVPCGHLLHKECFSKYLTHDYRCALCRCSMIDMSNMWKKLQDLVDSNGPQCPSRLRTLPKGKCNDCGMRSVPQTGQMERFVTSGLVSLSVGDRCEACGSFNTL